LLTAISSKISYLNNLEHLELSRNNFSKFPEEITELSRLETLIISRNTIENLPKSISKLKELKKLDLWSNEIEKIPFEITELKKLKELDLRVIQFNDEEQQMVLDLLPNTKVYFSKSCNCGY
jgi:Leucine-rich repeat (LRR) protein